jgi:hypothetical protein
MVEAKRETQSMAIGSTTAVGAYLGERQIALALTIKKWYLML